LEFGDLALQLAALLAADANARFSVMHQGDPVWLDPRTGTAGGAWRF